jgi:WhiB family redox-sensing transcriptional regulator
MSQPASNGQHTGPMTPTTLTHRHDTQPDDRPQRGALMQMTSLFDGLYATDLDDTQTALDIPCRENDADLWFAERPEDVEFAKALCRTCPVREACLAGAKERREPWGVWGGELFLSGIVIPRKRPRGRPRKTDVAA